MRMWYRRAWIPIWLAILIYVALINSESLHLRIRVAELAVVATGVGLAVSFIAFFGCQGSYLVRRAIG